ncbi:NAD(P)/FAD-dependent oxidoreductase, partial [candidate division FCPU426 bacterium]|nr:NAD(P)/FAD-dependent oxidoreductase [candidate division FCPU426 bacterium]
MLHFTCTVIGAGVVGLAVARALAHCLKQEDSVLVVEKENTFGAGISSRNSEVIHAGLYYPTGTLKHLLCVQGRRMLYEYCRAQGVPHNKCGKLIVAATAQEADVLEKIYLQARANEVEGVARLDGSQAQALEPDIRVAEAIFSAETGICNTHALMQALVQDITDRQGTLVYHSEVKSIERLQDGYHIQLGDHTVFSSEVIVNSSGLQALEVSAMLGLRPETLYPCKGSYFAYPGQHHCRHLVYPVPEQTSAGLGVHATLDLGGRLKFGPDAEYIEGVDDFSVAEDKKEWFAAAARRLFPALAADRLLPDLAGIRPKIQGPG